MTLQPYYLTILTYYVKSTLNVLYVLSQNGVVGYCHKP